MDKQPIHFLYFILCFIKCILKWKTDWTIIEPGKHSMKKLSKIYGARKRQIEKKKDRKLKQEKEPDLKKKWLIRKQNHSKSK